MPEIETPEEDLSDATAVFLAVRPRLFGIAYRMLGSAADAEDLVQEVWLRWQRTDRAAVQNPAAYLATAVTRLAINASRSARARHETYPGQWLPEPVDTAADPQLGAERGAALELAVLLLLEKLSPTERAAYVLREAFDYPYRQIADIVQTTEVAARQLVSRARRRLAADRRRPVDREQHERMLTAFVGAARSGDLAELERLLSADVVSTSDGGGLARATKMPVVGVERVAKFVRAIGPRFWPGTEVVVVEANGQPVLLVRRDGEPVGLVALDVAADGIQRVMWQINPEKLATFRL
ncbi:RNA polymerase sigma24 factor [Actinocatenispora thailandica]|uniref:RNA polymerase sigma24 factor n=1 Tax=Actinocatenispora thailandica TaxID=227318 RepID=A0A7R7DQ47_9ACTN|nr:RNA polymerase sigma-70 factor [Actinocatenispora thailandica]BCJ35729.1 RNA polymerase sigma24 factor [Actinocatenispora thailandica]